jgi:hypothetical protein
MSNDQDNWITVTEAAGILRMTPRQVNRYGNLGRLRTRRAGRRILYLASDVATLADELRVDIRPEPTTSLAVPLRELLEHLQARDRQLEDAQQRVEEALARIERQTSQPRQLRDPSQERAELRELLQEVLAEREEIQRQQQQIRPIPWGLIVASLALIIGIIALYLVLAR